VAVPIVCLIEGRDQEGSTMPANVIEIEGLRKEYRRRHRVTVAVDDLHLSVPAGGVFGFLGPNGSGKTTTIRCLLGLVRPTAGAARLLGCQIPDRLPAAIGRVGAIVEAPALLPTMSGRDNLVLLAAMDRIGPARADAVLAQVGLTERAGDPVGKYSLGMRQRLGLAAALLKDPELLILDEPANGLDPAGIRGVRQLLRRLADEGRTVFVSSHQLAEVEQTCDRVAILRRGRCVAQGTVAEVLAATGRPEAVLVGVPDPVAARTVLHRAGLPAEVVGDRVRVAVRARDAGIVNRTLGEHGHWVHELVAETGSLEELFLEMTGTGDGLYLEEVGV
jgi:ABC-2 type transport system ATP-binding protein